MWLIWVLDQLIPSKSYKKEKINNRMKEKKNGFLLSNDEIKMPSFCVVFVTLYLQMIS